MNTKNYANPERASGGGKLNIYVQTIVTSTNVYKPRFPRSVTPNDAILGSHVRNITELYLYQMGALVQNSVVN